MSKIDKLYELYQKDREYVINNKSKISKEIPMDYSTICKAIKKWEKGKIKIKGKVTKYAKKFKSGGGLEAFRNQYDDSIIVPTRIEEGIDKFLRSSEGQPDWMRDKDFREACGVSVGKWRRYADDYKDLQVTVNGEIIWGHPDIIEEMRRAVQR